MSPRLSPSELFLKAQTDERLLALAAEGHGRAFAVLIERHRRALTAHARRLVGPGREEDVVQQALLRAWTSLERGAEVRHAQAWLHRIVHNAALTEIERQVPAAEPLSEQLVDPRSAAATAEQRLQVKEVLQGVSALPERQRLALLGTELEGRSRRQLAAELGLSEGAIRQLVHRARDGVRAAMAAFIPFPLLMRAMRASGWVGGAGAPPGPPPAAETIAASGLATGAIVKAGAVVLAVGALGGGLVLHAEHGAARGHGRRHAGHRDAAMRPLAVRPGAGAHTPALPAAIADTALRRGSVAPRGVRMRRDGARAAVAPAAVALAPAIPQPQTSIGPAPGSQHATGGSPASTPASTPAAGRPSGSGRDQSRSGSAKDSPQGSPDTTSSSSGDSHPATDPAVPASTGSSVSGADQSASSSGTGTDQSSSPQGSPSSSSTTSSDSPPSSGSSSDSTTLSGSSSDSSGGQSTTTSSTTATTTSTPPASGG